MFATLLLSAALANPTEGAVPSPTEPAVESLRPDPRGKAMKLTGIAVTAQGLVIAATGGGLALHGALSVGPCGQPDCNTGNAYAIFFGGAIAASSVPFLATGIPLWIVGQNRIDKRRKAATSKVDLQVTPTLTRPGLVVSGRW